MSNRNRFAQHSVNTPSSSHAIQKSGVVDAEEVAPFTQRHGFVIVRNAGVRFSFCSVFDRSFESFFNAPSSFKSAPNYVNGDVNSGCPVCHAQSFHFVCEHHILSCVSVLLMPCLPSTVVRFVVAVIVYSSYRSVGKWLWSHVFKKSLKGFPSVADFYSSTAVVFSMFVVWVGAAIQHYGPYLIFRAFRHSVFSAFALFASGCFALSKAFSSGNFFVPAFAYASPYNATFFVLSDAFYYRERSKGLSSDVFEARSVSGRIRIAHVSSLLFNRNVGRVVPQLELRYRSLFLQNTLAA